MHERVRLVPKGAVLRQDAFFTDRKHIGQPGVVRRRVGVLIRLEFLERHAVAAQQMQHVGNQLTVGGRNMRVRSVETIFKLAVEADLLVLDNKFRDIEVAARQLHGDLRAKRRRLDAADAPTPLVQDGVPEAEMNRHLFAALAGPVRLTVREDGDVAHAYVMERVGKMVDFNIGQHPAKQIPDLVTVGPVVDPVAFLPNQLLIGLHRVPRALRMLIVNEN